MGAKRPSDASSNGKGVKRNNVWKNGGFSSIKSFTEFQAMIGDGELPLGFPRDEGRFTHGVHAAQDVPKLKPEVAEALLLLLSRPITQFEHVMNPANREKPRYLLLAQILAALRRGPLVLGAEDLKDVVKKWLEEEEETKEEEEAEEDEEEAEEEETKEEDEEEEATGPAKLVVLQAPEGSLARRIAQTEGVRSGVMAGCKAVMMVEVKAWASFENLWQAFAAGMSLAQGNAGGEHGDCYPASPVHVVVTDTRHWYFLGIQAMAGPAMAHSPAGSGAAPSRSSGAAAGGSSASAGGLYFQTRKGNTFRLFDCSMIYAPVTGPSPPVQDVLKVMYRLYTALYPNEDINGLPAAVREGDEAAKKAANDWLASCKKRLEEAEAAKAAAAAEWIAEAKIAAAKAEARAHAKARAKAEARAKEAEARAKEAEAWAKAKAEARAQAEAWAKAEAEARAQAEAKAEAMAKRIRELEAKLAAVPGADVGDGSRDGNGGSQGGKDGSQGR